MVDFEFKLKAASKTGATETPSETPVDNIAEKSDKPANTQGKTDAKVADNQNSVPGTTAPDKPAEQISNSDNAASTDVAETTSDENVLEAPSYNTGGGILDPVKWTFSAKKVKENEYDLIYTASIEPGWHIYSQYLDGDDGPIATAFEFSETDNLSLVGKTKEEGPKRLEEYDKFFGMNLVKFKKEAIFTQRVKVNDPSQAIDGYLTFMCCEAGRCLPPADVDFWLEPASLTALLGEEAREKIGIGGDGFAQNQGIQKVGWKLDGNVVNQEIASIRTTYENPVGDCGKEDNAKGQNFFVTFFLGFVGGLLALLTPCVFPMIPLTVSFFTKGSDNRKQGLIKAFQYGFFIFLVYQLGLPRSICSQNLTLLDSR